MTPLVVAVMVVVVEVVVVEIVVGCLLSMK